MAGSSQGRGHRGQIVVGPIGLAGALGAALVADPGAVDAVLAALQSEPSSRWPQEGPADVGSPRRPDGRLTVGLVAEGSERRFVYVEEPPRSSRGAGASRGAAFFEECGVRDEGGDRCEGRLHWPCPHAAARPSEAHGPPVG